MRVSLNRIIPSYLRRVSNGGSIHSSSGKLGKTREPLQLILSIWAPILLIDRAHFADKNPKRVRVIGLLFSSHGHFTEFWAHSMQLRKAIEKRNFHLKTFQLYKWEWLLYSENVNSNDSFSSKMVHFEKLWKQSIILVCSVSWDKFIHLGWNFQNIIITFIFIIRKISGQNSFFRLFFNNNPLASVILSNKLNSSSEYKGFFVTLNH